MPVLFHDLNALDLALAFALVIALPVFRLWTNRPRLKTPTRAVKFLRSIALIAILLALLVADWIAAGRTASALGFDWPIGTYGLAGLAFAVILTLLLAVSARSLPSRRNPEAFKGMPRTKDELRLFLVLAFGIGCGWEILYRGFLLWALAPRLGMLPAVAVAALAYGFAQGYTNARQMTASIVSAFGFTIAFALTQSLWWLMLLHTAFAVQGGWVAYAAATRNHRP